MAYFLGFGASPRRPAGSARDRLRVLFATHQGRAGLTQKQAAILAESFSVLFSPRVPDHVVEATIGELEAAFEIRNSAPENTPAAPNSGIILEFPRGPNPRL
jgi:hypothetical protein